MKHRPRSPRSIGGRVRGTVAFALVVAGLAAGGVVTATSDGTSQGERAQSAVVCPRHPQRLPANAVAGATNRALRAAPRLYGGLDTRGRLVTAAVRGRWAGVRGEQISRECGRRVRRRSVVVYLLFPRMLPSASLSQGTVFVALVRDRYRVWEIAH
jgi:hypothetical protein